MTSIQNTQIPVRLSYSTLNKVHKCERLFQLDKLLEGTNEKEFSEHFSAGNAIGAGIASYMLYQDKDRAIYEAWLAYWPEIETDKKNQVKVFAALETGFYTLDDLLQDWEVVVFEGKPAVELSFRLNINENYYYVGYIDVVIKNKTTGQYAVMENKHTGLQLLDLSPLYKHSGQALGYSIVLDKIASSSQSSYGVVYFVLQMLKDFKTKVHILPYEKSITDRLNWFITLGLDVSHLEKMAELNTYPLRSDSCLQYNRPCVHFGTCHLFSADVKKVFEEDTTEYQFVYELDEIIEDHLKRLS